MKTLRYSLLDRQTDRQTINLSFLCADHQTTAVLFNTPADVWRHNMLQTLTDNIIEII